MKYAITYDHNMVFQHFGKCPMFLLVTIEEGILVQKELLSSNGSGHGALVNILKEADVRTLVCGGIGQGARDALVSATITLISGASGNVDDIIDQLKQGTLQDDPSGMCNHHHDGEEHACGSHDCSNHK